MNAVSANAGAKPAGKLGYGWGYFYAVLWGLFALFHWYKLLYIESKKVHSVQEIVGFTSLCIVLIAAAMAVGLKHKITLEVVYFFAVLSAFKVFWDGLILVEIAWWVILNVPFIRYFRRRKAMFSAASPTAQA